MTAPAGAVKLAQIGVEGHVAEREPLSHAGTAAHQRMQPCDELLGRERLDEVVVGADVQPCDPVGDSVARRQHQDRQPESLVAQPPADREPVHAGQGDIEHHEVGRGALDCGQGCAAVRDGLHGKALGEQAALEHSAQRVVVVDDQDPLGARLGCHQPPATSRRRKTR